ncbi:hypothetical protein [Kibdelosporangium persicum]|uniref:hypothetical protein n=1 Tax=Kibdelosporangium persicum TaxID=2698649 RepID=UPI001562FEA2|nr:hypothetical protein [Kibdelosporangium persicum]
MSRSARVWLTAAVMLTVAGCAGQVDLGKSVTNRTTVKAAGSFNDDALRTVDPCGLLADDLLSTIGKKKQGVPDRRGYSECSHSVTDPASGKDIRFVVKVGADLIGAPKQVGKSIAGLGVFETRTSSGCSQTAVTTRGPDHGLVVAAYWDSGDPCDAAIKLLEGVVRTISEGKSKYDDTPGSLVRLNPCAAIDDKSAAAITGATTQKEPDDIRGCRYRTRPAYISVKYTIDFDPGQTARSYSPVKVDLTDKVKGAWQFKTNISPDKCQIEWVHRALSGNRGENVNVSFERDPPDPGQDPCAKAVEAARLVATKLATS